MLCVHFHQGNGQPRPLSGLLSASISYLTLPGRVTGADADHSLRSVPPLVTVAVLPNPVVLSGGDLMSCTLILLLLGHGERGRWTFSREKDKLRPNSRIRAGVVETTRDVRKGRLAKRMTNVVSRL